MDGTIRKSVEREIGEERHGLRKVAGRRMGCSR